MESFDHEKYLHIEDVGRALCRTRRQVDNLVQNGTFTSRKYRGRTYISKAQVKKYLEDFGEEFEEDIPDIIV